MKVIIEAQHAVGYSEPRGIGHYSIGLIQSLLSRGIFNYELTFFDFKREMGSLARAKQYFGGFDVPIHECNDLDYRVAGYDESVYKHKTYNQYTETNGDVYHFMNVFAVPTNLQGRMVVTIHDLIWESFPQFCTSYTIERLKMGVERIERMNALIIADSKSALKEIVTFTKIPEESVTVVYQSYDQSEMYVDKSDVSGIVEGDYILYIGAVESRKNIVGIVSAFNQIAEKYRGLQLVIAGKLDRSGAETEIQDAIGQSQFRDRIVTPGFVDSATKRKLYSNAILFAFPSFAEGFGIPVLESMACGCPVITADNTSLPEVGGDAVVYVNASNTDQLAFEMERVIDSEQLRKELIVKGFLRAKEFTWDKTAEQVENVYRMDL